MTTKVIFGSNKLGTIHNEQLQAMLDKLHLGALLSARKTDQGAMGQTMFISSTEGEFVLKGNPLYDGQLEEEKFFIENIQKRTNVPVPTPYLIDNSMDIFGWSYSLMPLLKGEHLDAERLQPTLKLEDKLNIAESIASTLSAFHQWKVPHFGELNPITFEITPFKPNYSQWLFKRILYWLEDAKKYSSVTQEDLNWTHVLLEDSESAFHEIASPTFVMGDFKSGNFLVDCAGESWGISGVFDFTNSYFGDPTSDLIKMLTYYLDNDEYEIAKHMLNSYFGEQQVSSNVIKRLKVHMVQQRVLDWGGAKATKTVTWDDKLPFSEWVGKYTNSIEKLLI